MNILNFKLKRGKKRGLALFMVASLVICTFLPYLPARAAEFEAQSSTTQTVDSITYTINWSYIVAPSETGTGSVAKNLYIQSVLKDNQSVHLPATITIPGTIGTGNYPVVSIGRSGVSGDSLFDSAIEASVIEPTPNPNPGEKPTPLTIDASGATSLETVNANVLKGRSDMTLSLPSTVSTVESGVLGGRANTTLICDSLDATYNNASDVSASFTFKGYKNSTGADTFSNSVESETATAAGGSIKFIIDNSSLNDEGDTDNPARFSGTGAPFTGYVHKKAGDALVNPDLPAAAIPTRSYHTFTGYYTSQTGDDQVFGTDCKFIASDSHTWGDGDTITLYSHWDSGNVKVTFDVNGGTCSVGPQVFDYNTESTLNNYANSLSRTGYTFRQWNTKPDGTGTGYANGGTIKLKKNTTLYAIWDERSYRFHFNGNAPTGKTLVGSMSNQTVSYESRHTPISSCGFSVAGYTFEGWALSANASAPAFGPTAGVFNVIEAQTQRYDTDTSTTPIELYGIWKLGKYHVIYHDGSEFSDGVAHDEEYDFDLATKPTFHSPYRQAPIGKNFSGWSTSGTGEAGATIYAAGAEFDNNTFNPPLNPRGSVDLYGLYTPINYNVKYERLDSNDLGSDMATDTWTYGVNPIIKDCTYERPGHIFIGWSGQKRPVLGVNVPESNYYLYAEAFRGTFPQTSNRDLSATDNATITYYPVWKKASYTITYKPGITTAGAVTLPTSPTSYNYGDSFTLPTATSNGRTFKGWLDQNNQEISAITATTTGNKILTARWDNDHVFIKKSDEIETVTSSAGNLVTNGTSTGIFFKNGQKVRNIKITAYNGQQISGYTIRNAGGGQVLSTRTFSSPANNVTVADEITFGDYDIEISVTIKPVTYRITYNADGGRINDYAPDSYEFGTETVLPKNVTKTGYSFYGWKTQSGTIISTVSRVQSGNLVLTAVWEDPNVGTLPTGTVLTASANGKYVTVTLPTGKQEDISMDNLGITLTNGNNNIKFKLSDGVTYNSTVTYTAPKELPSTITAVMDEGRTSATITYSDKTKQTIALTKYNSVAAANGTKIYFDGKDGVRYTALLTVDGLKPSPSPSASPAPTTKPADPGDDYYLVGSFSYRVKSKKATLYNPIKWNAKTLTIGASVKIYGKSYPITKIAPDALYGMAKLNTLKIGSKVTSIGRNAIRDCEKLKKIYIYGKVTAIGKNAFRGIHKKAVIRIKAGKKMFNKIVKLIKKAGAPKTVKYIRI